MPLTDVSGKARALYEARRTRQAIEPFTDADPGLSMADGYVIAQQLTSMLVTDGDEVIGYKVGLTSEPMGMIGVSSPDHGPVLRSAVYAGEGLRAGELALSGGLTAAVSLQAGDVVAAAVDRLGSVGIG